MTHENCRYLVHQSVSRLRVKARFSGEREGRRFFSTVSKKVLLWGLCLPDEWHYCTGMQKNSNSPTAKDQHNHLYLVDGSSFLFRAFHALPILTRPDGTPVNAVLGFTNMLMKLLDDMKANHIAVIFDSARKTFRNDIFPEYKANRPEPPDELIPHQSVSRLCA